jgi:hypothetical protein
MPKPTPEVLFRYLTQKAVPPAYAIVTYVIPEDHTDTKTGELWEYEMLVCLN